MKKCHDELAFVLHRKPYLETSLLVDVFTQNHGRFNLIARGGRRAKSEQAFLWQPFIPLKIGWSGRTDLPTAIQIEKSHKAICLTKQALFVGLYLNELLVSVLPKQDPYPVVFQDYFLTLQQLESHVEEGVLRSFEKKLLSELGYGLQVSHDVDHQPILSHAYYQLKIGKGFELAHALDAQKHMDAERHIFSGKVILDFFHEIWTDESLQAAKHIMRLLFKPLLQFKSLHVRELFLAE